MSDSYSTVSNSPPASPSRGGGATTGFNDHPDPAGAPSSNHKSGDQHSVHSTTETELTVSRTLKFAGNDEEIPSSSGNNTSTLSMPLEFVPPTEGTPAALALAGKYNCYSSFPFITDNALPFS